MARSTLGAAGVLVVALLLAGCTPITSADPASPGSSSPATPAADAATPLPRATPDPRATPTLPPPAPVDTRTGSELDRPFTVRGVVVVSKAHPVSSRYVPPWAGGELGLHPEALAAFSAMQAAARADGLTLTIRSGYRDFATQDASFRNALRTYDEATARRYFAEAGRSEHQTGLAFDVWDGRNRGSAFARTPHAAWVAEHAPEFGLIVRYPQGKTDITGYAWESWHLRWVGTEISSAFADDADLTLEEYLGLA